MTEAVRLDFSGPFSWCGAGGTRCVFGAPEADRAGIYLWTVEHPQGDLALYVGETGRNFQARLLEHLRDQLAGVYAIYEPAALRLGTRRPIWKGVVGRDREPDGLSEYAYRLLELAPSVAALVQLYRFHLAPTTCESRIWRGAKPNGPWTRPGSGAFRHQLKHASVRSEANAPLISRGAERTLGCLTRTNCGCSSGSRYSRTQQRSRRRDPIWSGNLLVNCAWIESSARETP